MYLKCTFGILRGLPAEDTPLHQKVLSTLSVIIWITYHPKPPFQIDGQRRVNLMESEGKLGKFSNPFWTSRKQRRTCRAIFRSNERLRHTHVTIPPRSSDAATSFLIELPKVKYPVARTIAAFAPQISSSPPIGLLVICRAEWSWTTYSMGWWHNYARFARFLKVNLTIVCRTKKRMSPDDEGLTFIFSLGFGGLSITFFAGKWLTHHLFDDS